jgi:hypothetical protein
MSDLLPGGGVIHARQLVAAWPLVSVEGDRWRAVAGSESRKTRDDE